MLFASNYRGTIPLGLYTQLRNKFPQNPKESDTSWLKRVKRDPMLAQKMFGTPEFDNELKRAVHQRTMALAGARRKNHRKAGPALIKLSKPGARKAVTTIARRYREELMIANESQYKYATEAYDLLLEQFDASTPADGSIFWNGINELALAFLVDKWNSEFNAEVFGQLEATTNARYVNKKFEWDDQGVFQRYFTEVSDRLGRAARGHITSVVRCGLRDDSIFTTTELPRVLTTMESQIKNRQNPDVTDITIVVIEPKNQPEQPIKSFTNNEITMIPIVRPVEWRINGRKDCTVVGRLDAHPRIRDYWETRGRVQPSRAAEKIKADFKSLVQWP